MRFIRAVLLLAISTILLGCSTLTVEEALSGAAPRRRERRPLLSAAPPSLPAGRAELAPVQQRLLEGAGAVLGSRRLVVRGRRFAMDCTGVVLAIYWSAGIDLARGMSGYRGGGVARLHALLQERGLLVDTLRPAPGDVVFWDDTYDRNRDGRWNDPLTHVGMVVHTEEDGTVVYIHYNYRQGIVLERMNLEHPDLAEQRVGGEVRVLNSPIRLRRPGRPHPPRWLAGQLFRDFGAAWQAPL